MRLKDILYDPISSNQAAHVKKRYISEIERLIYKKLETASILNTKGLLVTVDIIKVFNWLTILFLAVLQKQGFGERFLKCIQILIKNQKSCVVNGSITTKFFSLDKGVCQGNPISAFSSFLF